MSTSIDNAIAKRHELWYCKVQVGKNMDNNGTSWHLCNAI